MKGTWQGQKSLGLACELQKISKKNARVNVVEGFGLAGQAERLLALTGPFHIRTNLISLFFLPSERAHVGKQAKMVDAEPLPYAKTSVDVY